MLNKSLITGLVVLLLLGLIPSVTSAQGSEGLVVESMEILVSPEYDTQDVFVTYDAVFKNTSSSPYSGDIVFPIPVDSELFQTCWLVENAGGEVQHFCQLPTVEEKDGYKLVRWSIDDRQTAEKEVLEPGETYRGYVELYYNPIKLDGSTRTVEYTFTPVLPVSNLTVAVRPPLRSEGFVSELTSSLTQRDSQGFTYYLYNLGQAEPGTPVKVSFSYEKSDNRPSVEGTQAGQAASGNQVSEEPGVGLNWSVGALILFMGLAFGYFLYTATTGKGSGQENRAARRRSEKKTTRDRASVDHPVSSRRSQAGKKKEAAGRADSLEEEKRKARKLLLDGKISEQTYKEIVRDIERETRR